MTAPAKDGSALLAGIDWTIVRPPDIDSLSSVEGWQSYREMRAAAGSPPVMLTREQYQTLSPRDRMLYDLARQRWHSNLPKLDTPMAQQVIDELRVTLEVNMMIATQDVRRGVIVSANSNHGKTTVILDTLARHEDTLAMLYDISGQPPRTADRHIPVVAVTCPAKATIAKLCYRLLDFFGMPYGKRDSDGTLSDQVLRCLRDCGTKVVFIDEISRLNMRREDAQITFDFIRDIQNSFATLVLAGVDVEHTGLLTEGFDLKPGTGNLKTQTEARFTRLTLPKFSMDTPGDMQTWVDHLHAVEQQLMLFDRYDGMLSSEHADWLFTHTDDGVVGSLANLIRNAAFRAIERGRQTGVEVIDQEILERAGLDWASEKRRRAVMDDAQTDQQPAKVRRGSKKRTGDSVYAGRR